MMQKFALAALASFAAAENIPQLIETKMHEFMDHENQDYNVVITQISGTQNFILNASDTFADPNPVQTNNVEHFNVGGVFIQQNPDLSHVEFICYLQGAQVYKQDYKCSAGDSYCPTIPSTFGTEWKGTFDFDVPGFAPPFQYDVHVKAYNAAEEELFELESKFYIP